MRCCANILNLFVQEGLKDASVTLHNIGKSVKHNKKIDGKRIKFRKLAE